MTQPRLPHLNQSGEAHIVDIGSKAETRRRALAEASIMARPETIAALMGGGLGKGDALAVARVAGIMAAKKTAELIPLCHPIALTHVELSFERVDTGVLRVAASAETFGKTGVEMEAMTAAAIAALTLYDMAKSIDRAMTVSTIRLLEKSGGKSGSFKRQKNDPV